MADPVTEEEAKRAQARALLASNTGSDAPAPTQDMLNQAAVDQAAAKGDPDAVAAKTAEADVAPPAPSAPQGTALHDAFVAQYKREQAPAAPATSPEPTAGDKFKSFLSQDTGGDHEGMAVDAAVSGTPDKLALVETAPNAKPVAARVGEADAEAARRAEFNKLRADRARAADARLAGNNGGQAVVVSRGGMRPSSDTVQVTQGPEVNDSDRLLHEIEYNGVQSALGTADAEVNRDRALEGLQKQSTNATTKFASAERGAVQKESDALGAVSDRMAKALEASQKPVVAPAQELANMGIGQKLGFLLGSIGGAYAGRDSGENKFLQGYDKMVDARIDTQKREAEQSAAYAKGQDNLYGLMKQGFQSDDAARAATRLMYWQALDSKQKEAAIHYNIATANPRYQAMQAEIAQKILTAQMELAKISGQHISEEKTSKYVPPQVVTVGGRSPATAEKIKGLSKAWDEHKLGDKKADLDTVNNVIRNSDSAGVFEKYRASHPGSTWIDAYNAYAADPTQKQLIVDVQNGLKSSVQGNGMRSELGRDIAKELVNPDTAPQAYNRLAHQFAQEASDVIAANGGFDAYREWQRDSQDIRDSTASPVQAQGAEPLPEAVNRVPDELPPEPVQPKAAPVSHKKKAK